ncbi:MAG: hypothetical protein JNG89_00465 [Planctomycetaceae bacterium]|nr:hypothetical protein [Planctomycetaceae bacterium]
MPQIDVPEQQILESLDQLSPSARKEAIRRLLPGSQFLDRAIESFGPRLEAIARQRGLNWSTLSDEAREQLIDELLHE